MIQQKVKRFSKVIFIIFIFGVSLNSVCISHASVNAESNEWWIQMEIHTTNENQSLNDEILVKLYDDIIETERDFILSWHFLREPSLRFRVETNSRENRDRIAEKIYNYLEIQENIEDFYYANHGTKVDDLDDGYSGEFDQYQRMWVYQKKIWEWGSEMTVASIKEEHEYGENIPTREYQLTRTFHLLCLQLSPGFDANYCFRLDNRGGPRVFIAILSGFLIGFLFGRSVK